MKIGVVQRGMACLFMLSVLIGSACRKVITNPFDSAAIYYFNSFESQEDAVKWNGFTSAQFVQDPAPNSGSQSLRIGGGCIQPAAWIVLPKAEAEGWVRFSCWGKVDQANQSGIVRLALEGEPDDSREITVRIQGANWTHFQSENSLFCPKGGRLRIELIIGGIVFASMHVDGLTIEKND